MSKIRFFLFAALFFLLSIFSFAQDAPEKPEEILERETKLIGELEADAETLKLPENRAVVFAQIGGSVCQRDEKRAIQLFQKSINDLIIAQQEAEKIKKNQYTAEQLIYGQNPRLMILTLISACDGELALESLYKSRPAKISQMIAQTAQNSKANSGKQYYVFNETQNEQRFINLAADKNPERAVGLLRESLKRGVTYETLNLLRKIYAKDPKTADKLAEEVIGKLLGETLLTTDYQTSSTIQYFLAEFGRAKNPDQNSLEISGDLLRNLADKISAFWLENNNYNYSLQTDGFKVIEKYFPARAARIRQKQAQTGNQEYDDYNKLMQSDASPEEMLKQAEKFQSYKSSVYSTAARKTAQNGNIAEALNIINSNFSDEEAEQQISDFYYNLVNEAMSKGEFEQANTFINQIPLEQPRFSALIQLARAVYRKNAEENGQWATSILNQAAGLIDTAEITQAEITNSIELANAYALMDAAQAFRTLESIIPALNEFIRAYALVSQFRNEPAQRNGEFLITMNGGMSGAHNLGNALQILKDKDFDRTIKLINSFERSETRIALKLQIILRSISNLPMGTTRFSNFESKRSR